MIRETVTDLREAVTVTIADGQSLSDAVDMCGFSPVRVIPPAANWTAAALSFQGSHDGVTYTDVHDDGGEYVTNAVASGQGASVNHLVFLGVRYLKVRSGTSGAAVAQAGGDVVTLVLRRMS